MTALSVFAAARERPDGAAWIHGADTFTWADMSARAARAAGWLAARGVTPATRQPVALDAHACLETLDLLYALFDLGVPALLIHARATPPERAALLARTPHVLAVSPQGLAAELPAAAPLEPLDLVIRGDQTLAIPFTSGSGGPPKAVRLSRRAMLAAAAASAANLAWRADDRWLVCMPLGHVGGLAILVRCLVARATAVLSARFDPDLVRDHLADHRVTLLSLVPTQLRALVDLGHAPPPYLRAVLLGGSPAPAPLCAAARALGWPILRTYGLTEACAQVATERPGEPPSDGVGPPLPGIDVQIVDGEIHVGGPTLLDDYLPPDRAPFTPDGHFPTGDLGHLDARGHLHVTGRRTELIVTGGENVAPSEVERALEAAPGVSAALVFAIPDDTWGELVCAALVPDGTLDEPALDAHLRATLAPHRRPRRIAVVAALPTGPGGKPDRRAAARELAAHLRPLRTDPAAR